MGRATITSSIGQGLYKCRLQVDERALEKELIDLQNKETEYNILILKAMVTEIDLTRAKEEARVGLDQVIDQWKQQLIDKNRPAPPIEPEDPIDPETGQPWEDPDRAQDAPLFAAINAARIAAGKSALSRVDELDAAVFDHLHYLAYTQSIGNLGAYGESAGYMAYLKGYLYDVDISVTILLAYGFNNPTDVVNYWNKGPVLINASYTEAGVSFKYKREHPYCYLWGAIFATPGSGPGIEMTLEDEKNPAKEKALETDEQLNKIKLPETDAMTPESLAAACGNFALAAQKLQAAEREIIRLRTEHIERVDRIAFLQGLQQIVSTEIHIWACAYDDLIAPDDTMYTAEIPGFYNDAPVSRTSIINDVPYTYEERPINLVWPNLANTGKLRWAETMTDSGIFFNLAAETGTYRWRPMWRYGTITAMDEGNPDRCDVLLEATTGRSLEDEEEFQLDDPAALALADVPIYYPPCNGLVFSEGDEVLVYFEQFDRTQPKVIGFRREPIGCPMGRVSWRPLINPG